VAGVDSRLYWVTEPWTARDSLASLLLLHRNHSRNCAGLRSSNRTIHPVATATAAAAVWELLLPHKYQLLLLL